MSTSLAPLAVLGTEWAESVRMEPRRKRPFLGGTEIVTAPGVRYLDWTIDGQPLRDRLTSSGGTPCQDITPMVEGTEGDLFTSASLGSLLGEDEQEGDPWVRFSDGRAALLFCPVCFGLDCGAFSAAIVLTESTVEWRDIAYQDGMTEEVDDENVPSFSLRFDRSTYENTVRSLLERWGSPRTS